MTPTDPGKKAIGRNTAISTSVMPTIAPVPRYRNCWAALGYGGNGIVYSRIAAEIIASAFSGRRDADADLYAFEARR